MGTRLSIVQDRADQETIEAISRLLDEAKAGNVTGLAFVTIRKGGDYSGEVAGRLRDMPVYTLGLLHVLEKTVSDLIP